MELLSQGLAEKEAAAALNIKPKTVHKMVERIYPKLHVHNRGQAVAEYRARRAP